MKYFEPEDTPYFLTVLEQRRNDLQDMEAGGQQAAATVSLDQSRMGRLSRMDALQNQAISQETNRRREVELRRIHTALQRITDGEYGECMSCGEAIAFGRLEVDPATPLCIQCAEQAEQTS